MGGVGGRSCRVLREQTGGSGEGAKERTQRELPESTVELTPQTRDTPTGLE
jgi:hypothetical protein